jgi:murein L,D-transpeptidase YcbB/YkuD
MMIRRLIKPAAAATMVSILMAIAPVFAQQDQVAEAILARLDALQFTGELTIGDASIAAREILPKVYANRDFQPMWLDPERIDQLLALIRRAPEDGLDTADYQLEALRAQLGEARGTQSPLEQADLDILLTETLIRFGYHQLFGKVDPVALDTDFNFTRRFLDDRDPVVVIPEIIASPVPLADQLEQSVPRRAVYRTLQQHLATYRRLAAAGGWAPVPPGDTLRTGDRDPRVPALRARLSVSDDLPSGSDTTSDTFDAELEAAVRRFQARHGLGVDGIVGEQTYQAMNVPIETRIDQLRLSLERLRWVRADRSGRFIAVNIAGFRMFMVDEQGLQWTTRVMVGTTYRRTPVFRSTMSYMEINPTWTIPPTILRNDTLPAIKRDPGYLQTKNISVIDRDGRRLDPATIDWQSYGRTIPYTLRQEPGPGNALGEIKFILPNKHFVFMHDTPNRSLFDRPERTFSSGCIRVEDPFTLGELILGDPGRWDAAALKAVRDTRQTRRISTPRIPVLVLYLTASLEPDGSARFLKDIYARDAALLAALEGPVVIKPVSGAASGSGSPAGQPLAQDDQR